MNTQKLLKSIKAKWYLLKIKLKILLKLKSSNQFLNIDILEKRISPKKSIVVVCSGPSAKRLKPSNNDFYLVTNDSFKLVRNFSFLYYVNDGYFFRRYLANVPLCKNHYETIFFYRNEDMLHHSSFRYFRSNLNLIKGNNYLLSNFEIDVFSAKSNYNKFISSLHDYGIPIKVQNSGIFLLLLGFYLAMKYNKNLSIYGLDLGIGGKVHFEKGGHVGKSITSNRVKINTKIQLDLMYEIMKSKINNYSHFNAKT